MTTLYNTKKTLPRTYTHATDSAPDHAGGRLEVEWSAVGVGVVTELTEVRILGLVANERARNANLVASDDDDLLASKKLLGDDTGQAAEQMVTSVDNDSLRHLGFFYG
jgi:hypothetical protein